MSEVLKKDRKETKLTVLVEATSIQTEITRLIADENKFPKKYRILLGIRVLDSIDKIVSNLLFASRIYANTETLVSEKKKYVYEAILEINRFETQLIRLNNCVPSVSTSMLEGIISKLGTMLKQTKGLYKSIKVVRSHSTNTKINAEVSNKTTEIKVKEDEIVDNIIA